VKIEETERKIRERKEKATKDKDESDEQKAEIIITKKWGFLDNLSDWNINDKNESFDVKSIKLGDDLGKFNNWIEEGTKTCRMKVFFNKFFKIKYFF
jgi:hypothetical protein